MSSIHPQPEGTSMLGRLSRRLRLLTPALACAGSLLLVGCNVDRHYHEVNALHHDGHLRSIREKTPAGMFQVEFNEDGTLDSEKTGLYFERQRLRPLAQDEVDRLIRKVKAS